MKKKNDRNVYYGVAIFVVVLFGFLFELKPILFLLVAVSYLASVPIIMKNQEIYNYEVRRFHDINSYMSQMSQSFIYTKDVIKSLEETASCFTSGLMNEVLSHALWIVEGGKGDIKQAERDALIFLETHYDCEKLKNLHAFFLNTEEIGGECTKEFKILESMRIAWQGVVESIHIKKFWERNISAIVYLFFMVVCVVMLNIMRGSDLDIVGHWATQLVDVFLLLGFLLFYLFMDKRLTQSLLVTPKGMTEEKAEEYLDYLKYYNPKRERGKYMPFSVLCIVISIIFIYIKPSWITLALCACLVFVGCHMHVIIHLNTQQLIRSEIQKAFPKWLFDVMLLLQRESVEGALEKSYDTAPPILKRELYRINVMLIEKPHDPEAYMSFLNDFPMQSINEIMHKLYSLAVGANRDSEVLDVVMEKNIRSLEKAERDSLMFKDALKSFAWIPFLCAGIGCMGYLVIAIVMSVSGIVDLIR